jgi:predicted Zn-dependent protease with MMP-like domain
MSTPPDRAQQSRETLERVRRDTETVGSSSLARVGQRAADAFADLPAPFRHLCEGVVVEVVDFPDEATMDDMALESEFDILGLFRGIGMAQGGGADTLGTGQVPNRVWLYRRPILDYWAEHEETLGGIVTHVLVHEIGHHFGLSDDDMERIEARAD